MNNNQKGKDDRQYVSHSPQPYSKFKLAPTRNNLMVYGQNGQGHGPSADVLMSGGSPKVSTSAESKTLNAGGAVTIRNANGYPITNMEHSAKKNIERYQKGSFAQHNPRRPKAHSNNASGTQALKLNQNGILIGLPKVSKKNEEYSGRGNEFSPIGSMSKNGGSLKMPSLDRAAASSFNDGAAVGAGLPSLPRHGQQRQPPNNSDFKQAYENRGKSITMITSSMALPSLKALTHIHYQ